MHWAPECLVEGTRGPVSAYLSSRWHRAKGYISWEQHPCAQALKSGNLTELLWRRQLTPSRHDSTRPLRGCAPIQDGFTEGTRHSPPPQVRTPRLHTHPWKLPGTVILRFTSAFMTRLTIS